MHDGIYNINMSTTTQLELERNKIFQTTTELAISMKFYINAIRSDLIEN